MTSDLYRELVLDHWRKPRYAAALTQPTHVGAVVNEACGDSARVELTVHDETVGDLSVQVSGCALATAAGSVLAERIVGRSIDEVRLIDEAAMLELLGGIDPSASRRRCVTLALEALQEAVASSK